MNNYIKGAGAITLRSVLIRIACFFGALLLAMSCLLLGPGQSTLPGAVGPSCAYAAPKDQTHLAYWISWWDLGFDEATQSQEVRLHFQDRKQKKQLYVTGQVQVTIKSKKGKTLYKKTLKFKPSSFIKEKQSDGKKRLLTRLRIKNSAIKKSDSYTGKAYLKVKLRDGTSFGTAKVGIGHLPMNPTEATSVSVPFTTSSILGDFQNNDAVKLQNNWGTFQLNPIWGVPDDDGNLTLYFKVKRLREGYRSGVTICYEVSKEQVPMDDAKGQLACGELQVGESCYATAKCRFEEFANCSIVLS